MSLAFRAGFDHRALITGRRLLVALTDAVQRRDLGAAQAYRRSLGYAAHAIGHRHPGSDTAAHGVRDSIVLAGLVVEMAPLLAGTADKQLHSEVVGALNAITWAASDRAFELAALGWLLPATFRGGGDGACIVECPPTSAKQCGIPMQTMQTARYRHLGDYYIDHCGEGSRITIVTPDLGDVTNPATIAEADHEPRSFSRMNRFRRPLRTMVVCGPSA